MYGDILAGFCRVVSEDPVGSILKGKNSRLDEDEKTTYPRDNSIFGPRVERPSRGDETEPALGEGSQISCGFLISSQVIS